MSESKTQGDLQTTEINDKKENGSKIVKKYLRWINLYAVSKDKYINDIKRENSTGNFYNS